MGYSQSNDGLAIEMAALRYIICYPWLFDINKKKQALASKWIKNTGL